MLPELHDYLTPVAEHPEFSDEDIFSFRDGRYPADVPAGRQPVCPDDEHRHRGSARSYATRSAAPSTTSAARCHDSACDNDDSARACTYGSTPGHSTSDNDTSGDRARSFAIAVTGYDHDVNRQGYGHEEKEDVANHHPAGGPEVD
jgi:hypothetical protein